MSWIAELNLGQLLALINLSILALQDMLFPNTPQKYGIKCLTYVTPKM